MTLAPVLVSGGWKTDGQPDSFKSVDPRSGEAVGEFPISHWATVDRSLRAGVEAYNDLTHIHPETIARFLRQFADLIESESRQLAEIADVETGLGVSPRFTDIEIPRTVNQLRQAAEASSTRSWRSPVIAPRARIASLMAPIPGPVCVIGPNNFPFAFNSVTGGDAAAALATGHPIIAKANPGHPATTQRLAELALAALNSAGLPPATIQLLYRIKHEDGHRLVADPRLAATAYTGSREAGLALKRSAEAAGNLIYLEMSSINPVVILQDALDRFAELAGELSTSMLLGSGQFCTSPGLILLVDSLGARRFLEALRAEVESKPANTLLAEGVRRGLEDAFNTWTAAGARVMARGARGDGICYPNTVLEVSGEQFLGDPNLYQREAFGNVSLVVVGANPQELLKCLGTLDGNLTGSIFGRGSEGLDFETVATVLRPRVGRLLSNKVPTGVAVVDAMNHGGPYPSTGHPGFTAVGIPSSLARFTMLQCYDNVLDDLLPEELRASNPLSLQRRVDGVWTTASFTWGD